MGNLQSERIFSEKKRNSSSLQQTPCGGPSESTGHPRDKCGADHSSSKAQRKLPHAERRRSWSNNWQRYWLASALEVKGSLMRLKQSCPTRKKQLPKQLTNGYTRLGWCFVCLFVCSFVRRLYIVWSCKLWWKSSTWAGHSHLWSTLPLVGQKGTRKIKLDNTYSLMNHMQDIVFLTLGDMKMNSTAACGLGRESGYIHH